MSEFNFERETVEWLRGKPPEDGAGHTVQPVIKTVTYEDARLQFFKDKHREAVNNLNRYAKAAKDASYLSADAERATEWGERVSYYDDVLRLLKGLARRFKWVRQNDKYYCEKCGEQAYKDDESGYQFFTHCPYCGADMSGGVEQ